MLIQNKDAELEITIRVTSTAPNADFGADEGMYDDVIKAVDRLKEKRGDKVGSIDFSILIAGLTIG